MAVLARGQRAADIRSQGVVLENATTGNRTTTAIEVVDQLRPDARYDLVVVMVRKDQLASVLPILSVNGPTPCVLFMVNNALGPDELVQAVGSRRALFGLAGAGGTRTGSVVRYHVLPAWQQPTTLGELEGRRPRVWRRSVARYARQASRWRSAATSTPGSRLM